MNALAHKLKTNIRHNVNNQNDKKNQNFLRKNKPIQKTKNKLQNNTSTENQKNTPAQNQNNTSTENQKNTPAESQNNNTHQQLTQKLLKGKFPWFTFFSNQIEIDTLPDTDLIAIAQSELAVNTLLKANSFKQTINKLFDRLYMHINSTELLTKVIHYRFNIHMGSANSNKGQEMANSLQQSKQKTEQNWTIWGLQRAYGVFMGLPQKHTNAIDSVITTNTQTGSGGAAYYWLSSFYVDYKDNNNAVETGQHGTVKGNARWGLHLTDHTIAHELGHVVDLGPNGGNYSSKDQEFLDFSGWKQYPTSEPEKIVELIENNASTPFNPNDDEIKDTVRNAAKEVVTKGKKEEIDNILEQAVTQNNTNIDDTEKAQKKNQIKRTTLFRRTVNALAQSTPWYTHEANYSDATKHIHQSYSSKYWVAYNHSARTDGTTISEYQFRDPCEEFAELYATYHVANPKGSTIDSKRKAWFEKKGLHK